jgi:hypothetical protein
MAIKPRWFSQIWLYTRCGVQILIQPSIFMATLNKGACILWKWKIGTIIGGPWEQHWRSNIKTPIIENFDNIIRDFKVQIVWEVLWRGVLWGHPIEESIKNVFHWRRHKQKNYHWVVVVQVVKKLKGWWQMLELGFDQSWNNMTPNILTFVDESKLGKTFRPLSNIGEILCVPHWVIIEYLCLE